MVNLNRHWVVNLTGICKVIFKTAIFDVEVEASI
jgi:hypothetical protein